MIDTLYSDIDSSWNNFLTEEKSKFYHKKLIDFLEIAYQEKNTLPSINQTLRVFQLPINKIKVVILGQDPYPTIGHANGLSFSVNPGVFPLPKSLTNIFKELAFENPTILKMNGDLSDWFNQGVFLLNTILTIEVGKPLSHKNIGWENFTKNTISYLQKNTKNVVYLLWGKNAHSFKELIDQSNNLIIQTSHPSPLGYTKSGIDFTSFRGSNQFTLTNEYLKSNKLTEIIW